MAYDNTNRGILSKNDRMREGKNDPPYTGTINIDGQEYWLSAWVKERKESSNKFFSLSVKPKGPAKSAGPSPADDDIPL